VSAAERLAELMPEVVRIARSAGSAVMDVYNAGFTVTRKADNSPITAADEDAQTVIEQGLLSMTPRTPVVSEESELPPWRTRKRWSTYWLVDPLDGTREFIRRNNQFAVNIALIHDGRPVLGVVHSPARDTTWYGGRTLGAWRRRSGGRAERIHTTTPHGAPLRVVLGRAVPGPRTRALLKHLPEHRIITCGASLKLCLIADGRADLFPRFGPISEWDLAAPEAVLEGAGGMVASMDTMERLRYNTRDIPTTADILAFGDPTVKWKRCIVRP